MRNGHTTGLATGLATGVLVPVLMAAVAGLTSGCLPDQVDGRQERIDAAPALDFSWFDDTAPLDVVDAGLVAMAELGSVRMHQDAENAGPGDPVVSKDLLLATGAGIGDAVAGDCTGTLQLPSWGEPAELVVQDDLGAFRGTTGFWASFEGEELDDVRDLLVEQYADRWATTPGLAALCDFTDFLGPAAGVLDDDAAAKAGLGDVAGVPAGRVVSKSKKLTVTTWVQIAEPHLILRIGVERRGPAYDGSNSTVTTFSDPDTAVDVDFPAQEDIVPFELPTPLPTLGDTELTDTSVTDG